jgi:hypothetical protein
VFYFHDPEKGKKHKQSKQQYLVASFKIGFITYLILSIRPSNAYNKSYEKKQCEELLAFRKHFDKIQFNLVIAKVLFINFR